MRAGYTNACYIMAEGRERETVPHSGLLNLRISRDVGNGGVTASHRIDPGQVSLQLARTFP